MEEAGTVNGVEFVDDPSMNGIVKKDQDLEKLNQVSDLERKIESLEEEKFAYLGENKDQTEKIKLLTLEIDEFKRNQAKLENRLEWMQMQINQAEDDKKGLQVITARASELETEVFRLQHDFQTSVMDCEETSSELKQLIQAYEELKQRNQEKDSEIEGLEKEKVSLMGKMDESKAQMENQIRDLDGEAKSLLADKQKLEKEKKEVEALKSSLEEKLKKYECKLEEREKIVKELKDRNLEMEGKLMDYTAEKVQMEKRILELEQLFKDEEVIDETVGKDWCFKYSMAASTGTVAAAALAMIYLKYAR